MKYVFKALIDGVISIVKLVIVLYALWWCYDTGVVSDIVNYFKQYDSRYNISVYIMCLCLYISTCNK